jgi:GTP-binding protein
VGRSNVGKSSAINTLLGRKKAARVSGQPGRTQLINCFRLNEKIRFVDLPGYGFAKVPLAVKRQWGQMIEKYLLNRTDLKLVVILVDVRHSIQEMDVQMVDVVRHYNIPFVIVATKADKLKRNALSKQMKLLKDGFGVKGSEFKVFSSLSGQGYHQVWTKIEEACGCIL